MSKHLLARYQKIKKGVRKKLLKCIKIFLKKNKKTDFFYDIERTFLKAKKI